MTFEKYEGQGKAGQSFVSTMRTKNGIITCFYLSVAISQQLRPGLKYIRFYFDREQGEVAIRFLDAEPTGYFITLQKHTRGVSVPCRAFCRHYGIKYQKNIPAKLEDESDGGKRLVFPVEVSDGN